jgi:Putative adhesin
MKGSPTMINMPPQETTPVQRPPTQQTPPERTSERPPERPSRNAIGWLIGAIVGALLLFGLFALLVASIAGWFLVGGATTRYTDTTSKTFTVPTPVTLTIQNPAGNVTIRQGNASQVTVQVTKVVRTLNQNVATRELNQMIVDTTQNGATIQVQTNYATSFFDGVRSSRSVDLLVTTPQQTAVTLRLNAGNATVSDLQGKLDLQLNAGNLTVSGAQVTDSSSLRADAGNITASLSMTPKAALSVQVNAGNTSLTLPANTPAHLDARVNVGSISVTGWSIPVTHSTPPGAAASGDLGTNATGDLQIQVNVGAVTLRAR